MSTTTKSLALIVIAASIAVMAPTVAPALAARVAAILRNPCGDLRTPAARQALRKTLPKLSAVSDRPVSRDECEIAARTGV
jgi:hypothetical protein